MALDPAQIRFRLTNGSNPVPPNIDPNQSLGGTATGSSLSDIVSGDFDRLFDSVSPSEKDSGTAIVEYRALDIVNLDTVESGYLSTFGLVSVTGDSAAGMLYAVAKDTAAGMDTLIANERATPNASFVDFGTTGNTSVSIGTLGPSGRVRIWIRRTKVAGSISPDAQHTANFQYAFAVA